MWLWKRVFCFGGLKNYEFIIKKKIPTIYGERRNKDIKLSIADTKKFNKHIRWKPKFNNLKYILKTSLQWEKKLKSINNN